MKSRIKIKDIKRYSISVVVISSVILGLPLLITNNNDIVINAFGINYSLLTDECTTANHPGAIDPRPGVLALLKYCSIPSPVYVGDNFTIYALVINYLNNAIRIDSTGPDCDNPLTVNFDKNVKTTEAPVKEFCVPFFSSGYLVDSREWAILSTNPFANLPARGITSYLATSAGETNATMELKYRNEGNSSIVSINQPFEFNILPRSNSTSK